MSELSDEARALLAREAPLDEPTAAELERGRAQIFASLGIPLPPAPSDVPAEPSHAETAGVPNASGFGLGMKLAAVSLAVGLVAAGVVMFDRRATPVPPDPSVAATPPSTMPATASTPQADVLPEAPREADTIAPPPNNTPVRPVPAARDALATESMLVAAAEAQLRAGHASEALSLFDRYLTEHPRGALRHESLAGRIASLCRLGRLDAGRAELARFSERFPRSPSLPRLGTACGVEP